MHTHRTTLTLLSLGALVAALAAWRFAAPSGGTSSQGEDARTVSLAATADDNQDRLVASDENEDVQEDEGCCCCGKDAGGCCSQTGGKRACGKSSVADAGLAIPHPEALALNTNENADEEKQMMKPSAQAMAKGTTARKAIEEHRKALTKDGVYGCCIKPGCTFCSTAGDMCPCAMNLEKGGSVCPECWGGWVAGQGRLKGVDASKVQVIPKSKLKMMYDMKAKNFDKAATETEKK